jgi:hypothetical protein
MHLFPRMYFESSTSTLSDITDLPRTRRLIQCAGLNKSSKEIPLGEFFSRARSETSPSVVHILRWSTQPSEYPIRTLNYESCCILCEILPRSLGSGKTLVKHCEANLQCPSEPHISRVLICFNRVMFSVHNASLPSNQ